MKKRIQLVTNAVSGNMVRKEEFQGEMHYMIRSATMPDDIVMNGILYPAEEIESSYQGLNYVHAPLGHPVSDDGEFLSASDPFAVRHYYIGAQVVNVERKNGKVYHDTAINIAAAKQSDRGKRVLDRVEALMNGDDTRPIHTSTGIWLNREDLEEPQANQYGEYYSIGRGLIFDHNAILLDEVGAATPEQGTGMAVNSASGQEVFDYMLNAEQGKDEGLETKEGITFTYAEEDKEGFFNSLKAFIKSMGFASSNHETYNDNVNNQTNEEFEMTPEEKAALVADIAKEVAANLDQSIADAVASAVEPISKDVNSLKANAEAGEKAEKIALAEKLGLEADEVDGMSVNSLKKLAAKADDAGEFAEDRLGALSTNSSKDQNSFSDELPEG